MGLSSFSAPPWWLVPNLIALDAPLVAVVWQRFLGHQFRASVPWAATLALGFTVWSIYLADRWLDVRRGALQADRHRAVSRNSVAIAGMCLVSAVAAAIAATQLSTEYHRAGLILGFGVIAYLALVHAVGARLRSLPRAKELLVAIGFVAGVAIPLFADGPTVANWLPSVVAFGGVCFLNCRLIERWEVEESRPMWPEGLIGVAILIGCVALPIAIGAAIAASLLGLLLVHVCLRCRPRVARVLADAVLLTPLFVGCVPDAAAYGSFHSVIRVAGVQ